MNVLRSSKVQLTPKEFANHKLDNTLSRLLRPGSVQLILSEFILNWTYLSWTYMKLFWTYLLNLLWTYLLNLFWIELIWTYSELICWTCFELNLSELILQKTSWREQSFKVGGKNLLNNIFYYWGSVLFVRKYELRNK